MAQENVEASRRSDSRRGPLLDRIAGVTYGPGWGTTLSGIPRAVLLAGMVIAGAALSLVRTPIHVWNTLWAEDGAIFVRDALSSGPDSLFGGYAGYMHLVPRIGAGFAVLFPLEIVPLVVTLTAAVITSLIATSCFVFMETRLLSIPLRFEAWIACLLLPVMGGEVANSLANLHWYLLIAGFCAMLARSRSRAFAALQSVVLFAAVTSDALALLLLPFAICRWLIGPRRRDRVPSVVFAAGAAIQIVVMIAQLVSGGRPIASARPTALEFLDLYASRVAVGSLFGVSTSVRVADVVGPSLPWIVVTVIAVALVIAAWRNPDRRVGIAAFGLSSLAFAVVVFSLQWAGFAGSGRYEFFTGGRYAMVPTALLVLALLQAVDAWAASVRAAWSRTLIPIAALSLLLVPAAIDIRASSVREGAVAWADGLRAGAADCAAGVDLQGDMAIVGTAPPWFGGMQMPCRALEAWEGAPGD